MKKNSPETLETAIEKAAHYCADAEHCRFDVARKLHQWQVQKEWYQPVMNTWLQRVLLMNDGLPGALPEENLIRINGAKTKSDLH